MGGVWAHEEGAAIVAQMTALLQDVPWHLTEGCLGFVPMAAERDKLKIKSL